MQDDTATYSQGRSRSRAVLAAMCALAACGPATAAEPPPQVLAGQPRPAASPRASVRPTMAEAPAEAVPPIPFLAGSAKLTPSATRILDGLSRRMAGDRLRVEGFATNDRDLADRRAKAVASYLAENCGVDARRVETAVMGGADRQVLVVDLGS